MSEKDLTVGSMTDIKVGNSSQPKVLAFDGSHLGEFNMKSVVMWVCPCSARTSGVKPVVLYAIVNFSGHNFPVILKRNCSGKRDQNIVDELKPLFGLNKMGTHSIRLKGIIRKQDPKQDWIVNGPNGIMYNMCIEEKWSDYFLFRADVRTHKDGTFDFMQYSTVENTVCFPTLTSDITPRARLFFYEVQKILVFRHLLRISGTNLSDILVRPARRSSEMPTALSIDEMTIKAPNETYKKVSDKIEKHFFIKTTSRSQVLMRMLNLNRDDYPDKIEAIRNSMIKIITRIDDTKLWLVDTVINQLVDRAQDYYTIINSED